MIGRIIDLCAQYRALVLLMALAFVSGRTPGPGGEEGESAEARRPGLPLVMKVVILVFALWAAGYTAWVILSGQTV